MKITIIGGTLHQGQLELLNLIKKTNSMYYTIVSPRQWGKSFMAVQLMLYYAINNKNSKLMLTSLTYSQASKIYKELLNGIKDSGVIRSKNLSENSIIFENGSELYFKSVQQPENLRGYSIDYLFIDEAASYKEDIFNTILRPMLTVKGKKCFLFSTPKGRNWFYDMYMLGNNNERYSSYRGISEMNPYSNREEINDAKKCLPDSIFKQEYEGEFIDDGGEIFLNIKSNSVIDKWPNFDSNKIYFCGIDVGRQNDYTVVTIMDKEGNIIYIERLNLMDWTLITSKVDLILKKYNPRQTLVECNGNGDVFYSNLKQKYSNITPFITSNQSKQDIIEELILSFQDNKIKIPTINLFKELTEELNNFTFTYSRQTRKISYGARNNQHDDCVMSLAFANHSRITGLNKGQYIIL